ncbi:MAG: hypothetical protein ACUVQT_01205 [bacterium]
MILLFLLNAFENFLFPEFSNSRLQFNPANLAAQNFLIALGGNEDFGLSSMRTWTAGIQVQTFQVVLKTFGNELYRENGLEMAGGFTVYHGLAAGIGIGVLNNWIKDHTNRFTYTVKLGGVLQLQNLKIHLCLNNVNSPKFSEIDCLPISYILGMEYKINSYLQPYFHTMGKEEEPPFFNFGLIAVPVSTTEFYAGISTENFLVEYGLRIRLRRIAFDYAGNMHRQLGLSHTFFVNLLK